MIDILTYNEAHFEGVDRLWRKTFPADPPRNQAAAAIPSKLKQNDGLFWVALDEAHEVIGTTMAGWDGHRGWIYAVAVAPKHQRSGVGKTLVEHAIIALKERGCGKVNLQIRDGNEAVNDFYKSLGFAVEPRTSMGLVL